LWLPEDRDAVLAFIEDEDSRCSGCGHPRDETFDEDNEHRYRGAAYECMGCKARDLRRDEDSKDDATYPGRMYAAVDRETES
jgi:hypothetical protein